MTVKELIKALGEFPDDAVVALYDHDEAAHLAIGSVTALVGDEAWGPLLDRHEPPAHGVVLEW